MIFVVVVCSFSYSSPLKEFDTSELKPIYAVSKGESLCNCTLDLIDDAIGFELPNVKITKSESMQSRTEGTLEWTESKQLAMDGVIVGDIYLANQSAGALLDLNTIRIGPNQLLGLEVTGGTLPDIVTAEVVDSSTAMNGTGHTLGDIQIDKKTSETTLMFNKSDQNNFRIQVLPQRGDVVLLISLVYNMSTNDKIAENITSRPAMSDTQSLTGIYKTILSIKQ